MAKTVRESVEAALSGKKEKGGGDDRLQRYLETMAKYEREFKKWEARVEKIIKRYRDEGREARTNAQSRFNILWSNVQTLVPATFSRLPAPDVSRRFRDDDPVGRVASLILERGLDFEIQHYTDYRTTMTQSVHDRFLGGRGTAWIRYEPHFKAGSRAQADAEEGQVTEAVENETPAAEQLDYECAPVDYVHWRDFGHSVARTWEEVGCVWRRVYMDEKAVEERFGKKVAEAIPYDASPDDLRKTARTAQENWKQQAAIFELWDKEEGCVYWFSKSHGEFLDERDDPLGLQEFFPCPRPLYATITNESLVPVPDFTLYQDQANELDVLADRIDGLTKMLQLKGVYDASADSALARLFTEGENGTLLPVKNWAAFAEKGGLRGEVDVYDLTPLVQALKTAQEGMAQVKEQVYEITGISDIIRGQTAPSETATAQQIKGQYASLRLRAMQDDVARYATEILQLKAQVMCSKFDPKTIAAISAVEQLSDADKQYIQPALALLVGEQRLLDPSADAPNPLRSFRIEVAADTLVQLDEQREKQDRIEFVTGVGTFIEKAAPVIAQFPSAAPLILSLMKFGVTAFKVGKAVEGEFDTAIDQIKQAVSAPKPPPPPPPEVQSAQIKAQAEAARGQQDAQTELQREAMRQKGENERHVMTLQNEDAKHQREMAHDMQKHQMTTTANAEPKIAINPSQEQTDYFKQQGDVMSQALEHLAGAISQLTPALQAFQDSAKLMVGPRKHDVIRGPDGRVSGSISKPLMQ